MLTFLFTSPEGGSDSVRKHILLMLHDCVMKPFGVARPHRELINLHIVDVLTGKVVGYHYIALAKVIVILDFPAL